MLFHKIWSYYIVIGNCTYYVTLKKLQNFKNFKISKNWTINPKTTLTS